MNLNSLIKTAKSKGYTIDTRPFALNLIGIRNSKATDQNTFDDNIAYFYYDGDGELRGKIAPATTDPSTFYLENPMNPLGAAILKSGEYRDTWRIGLHKGKYEALVQSEPVVTIRDDDRNSYINYFAETSEGLYGINIHKASRKDNVAFIDKDSAGCQVFRDEKDFNEMMSLAKISKAKYGNTFSYILIDERDTIKTINTTLLIGIALIGISYYLYKKSR
jgi:hypothetical protein